MLCLAVAMLTGVSFVVAFVIGIDVAVILGGLLTALVVATWVVLPRHKSHHRRPVRAHGSSSARGRSRTIHLAEG